ncbi:Transcription factor himD [Paramyrothecium foliicola]|nr:Transcription factor himD [Paramyrothecium foliicola]
MEVAVPSRAAREHWMELNAARRQRRLCAEQITAIEQSCHSNCGKPRVSECEGCYAKVVERMRKRFVDSPDQEWFTQRRAFLQELDGMFADAKKAATDLKLIEESIESEKEAWYRWVLRRYPEFLAMADRLVDTNEFRNMLDDPDRSLDEVIEMMWQGIGKPADWSSFIDTFAEKVAAARGDATALRELYVSEFFVDKKTGEILDNSRPYYDEFMAKASINLEDIIDKIIQDHHSDKKSQPRRDEYQSQLDALRRAKTAYEQKMKDKSKQQAPQAATASDKLQDIPPCLVCNKAIDTKDIISCSICQAVRQMGGEGTLTVYCSEQCYHVGHAEHAAADHDCDAGDQCIDLRDEDVTMGGEAQPVACKDCVAQKKVTLWCSERCAAENAARHRQVKHQVKTAPDEVGSLVQPLAELVSDVLEKENPGVKFTPHVSVALSDYGHGARRQRDAEEDVHSLRGLSCVEAPMPPQREARSICLDTKKECVSRTGPRVRRSRKAILAAQAQPQPPAAAAGASASTFTLNFAVSAQSEADDDHQALKESHSSMLDILFPESMEDSSASPSTMGSVPTPSVSSAPPVSLDDLHAKPQFNRSSAESLLDTFRSSMLVHFPCIVLSPQDTVGQLAATRPFVLLAILAAASGSKTLQGHVLYDEEFRKVLGLKFVAGGERSIELLQGILLYCAWYPFHLRPRNKQVYHYLRMAADLVHDLELEQDSGPCNFAGFPNDNQLDCIRSFLGFQYLASVAFLSPTSYKGLLSCTFTPWAMTCCDMLDTISDEDSDVILTTLVRLSSTTGSAWEAVHERKGQSEQQSRLALLGLETQLRSIKDSIPPHIASLDAVKIAMTTADIYLSGGATLLKLPRLPKGGSTPLLPDHTKLFTCCQNVREIMDYMVSLDRTSYACFTCIDWCKLIMAIIVAIRLSFPFPDCPAWDSSWARTHLQFNTFLEKMCEETDLTPASNQIDVLSATRVVLRVLKEKYEQNLIKVTEAEAMAANANYIGRCPMLDGSLSQYMPTWDPDITMTPLPLGSPTKNAGSQPVFHDLWATMTMGWADETEI